MDRPAEPPRPPRPPLPPPLPPPRLMVTGAVVSRKTDRRSLEIKSRDGGLGCEDVGAIVSAFVGDGGGSQPSAPFGAVQ